MEQERLQRKFRGALLGVAIGDALGAPFEGMSAVSRGAVEQLARNSGLMRYTDDTHMTLGLAASRARESHGTLTLGLVVIKENSL